MRTVDVVVPCYNYAQYLSGCVASILSQSGVNVRVLIIDDASKDDTPRIGQYLQTKDARVSFRRHDSNRGHIATYNEGLLEWSTADYTVLLSADDLLAPGCLSRAVTLMEADSTIGMVYGKTIHFSDEITLPATRVGQYRSRRWSGAEWLELRCRAGYNVITSPEVVVRGRIQREVGGYRAELPHAGDLEMWLRIAAVSDIAYVYGAPQAFYRVHPKSMMRTVFRGSFTDLRQRKEAYDAFFRSHAERISNAAGLKRTVDCALAREALWDACRAYDRDEVDATHVAALVEFALDTYPDAKSLAEWSALGRRRWLGPRLCHRTQLFAAPAALRRLQRAALKRRWQRTGV